MKNLLYSRFWRLHFSQHFYYAFIAVSHIKWDWLFVFTDVENRLYDDYFFGESHKEEVLTIDEAVEKRRRHFQDTLLQK